MPKLVYLILRSAAIVVAATTMVDALGKPCSPVCEQATVCRMPQTGALRTDTPHRSIFCEAGELVHEAGELVHIVYTGECI